MSQCLPCIQQRPFRSSAATITETVADENSPHAKKKLVLRLKSQSSSSKIETNESVISSEVNEDRRNTSIKWSDDTIDNEHLNKQSSKSKLVKNIRADF